MAARDSWAPDVSLRVVCVSQLGRQRKRHHTWALVRALCALGGHRGGWHEPMAWAFACCDKHFMYAVPTRGRTSKHSSSNSSSVYFLPSASKSSSRLTFTVGCTSDTRGGDGFVLGCVAGPLGTSEHTQRPAGTCKKNAATQYFCPRTVPEEPFVPGSPHNARS